MAQTGTTTGKKEAENERIKSQTREPLGKVIELIGNSTESFDDAVRNAVKGAAETIDHITGIEIRKMSAKVRDGEIAEYRVDLKLAFGVERDRLH